MFTEYAGVVFDRIRRHFGIDPAEYRTSLQGHRNANFHGGGSGEREQGRSLAL